MIQSESANNLNYLLRNLFFKLAKYMLLISFKSIKVMLFIKFKNNNMEYFNFLLFKQYIACRALFF